MASNHTQHLGLSQWEAEDEVLRADFNADNAKIDAAVAGRFGPDNLPWIVGRYDGTGEKSGDTQTITLGFKPKLLIIVGGSSCFGLAVSHGGESYVSHTTTNSSTGEVTFMTMGIDLTDTGFQVQHYSNTTYGLSMNFKGWSYLYFAVR